MIINSFVRSDFGFRPIRVEVVLTPGISQIQILGQADVVIKESSKRILSALRYQGFQIPPGKQVLVNLQPNYLKKSSQGLDLAIAIGILLESEQLPLETFNLKEDYFYGALGLKGEILVPEDLSLLNFEKFHKKLITGKSSQQWRFDALEAETLSGLRELDFKERNEVLFQCQDHEYDPEIYFETKLARLMMIAGAGEHPLLIAGYAGCGKTTLVENLAHVLPHPPENLFLESKKYWMISGRNLKTRPIVQPHHSATPVSMIGGGSHIKFGEISLAHGGVLILDELLEFHPIVQSALREPMEKGHIYLSRAGQRKTYPAQMLILATTNLCPCGQFQPQASYQCRCSSLKLRNYLERLTGPFLDRFSLFHLYQKPKIDLKVSLSDIKAKIEQVRTFALKSREQWQTNQSLAPEIIERQFSKKIQSAMIPFSKSHRRRQSLLRVARTLADLDESTSIEQHHLEEAQGWTASDIYKLERFRFEDFAMR